ncbi:hypothetical protein C8R46DRAFT_1198262 [Mycena filopes]|nr:hypothetical protein C8R46DRAFT_1198262 [Mycena filopes]
MAQTHLTQADGLWFPADVIILRAEGVIFRVPKSILGARHKYDVKYLFKRAIDHLEPFYPVELPKLDRTGGVNVQIDGYDDDPLEYDLEVISTFHRVGATWLLPYAYYTLGVYSVHDLLNAGSQWDNLPQALKQTCFLLPTLQIEGTQRLHDALTPLSTCESSTACDSAKFRFLKHRADAHWHFVAQDPLPGINFHFTREELTARLCDACAAQAGRNYTSKRAEIWDELPDNCGLEGWDVLLEQRRVALE